MNRLVWQHCLLFCAFANLAANGTLEKKKTYRLCVPMLTQQIKKNSKRKGSDVLKETTTNCDTSSRRVCVFTSFEGFVRNQPVFRSLAKLVRFVLSSKVVIFL